MSKDEDKIKHSRRLAKDNSAMKKQTKIAKSHGVPIDTPHKFAKHHAMDCGQPGCLLCGNRRKTFKELTTQEQRMFQDIDTPNDRHSNGLPPQDE
jgi:hypothetical protein